MNNSVSSSRPHYEILNGLRGVAAIVVVVYHIFEVFTVGTGQEFIIGHGYLAVDFFFALSGFVIGYAYDGRWKGMRFGAFMRRRVMRLHPMVVFGMVLGAVLFYAGVSSEFPLIADTPVWKMLLFLLLGLFLIPAPPSADIRGWEEMYTLDAPAWSLLFEYVANVLYGLFIRKFSRGALAALVVAAACATVYLAVFVQGDVSGGWTLDGRHLQTGFTRLIYPFFAGLLLYRIGGLLRVKHALPWCCVLLIAVLVMPRVGDREHVWMNGLYEAGVIILVFPLIVSLGAGGEVKGRFATKLCRFLGDMSYPIYLVNYPLVYLFTGWVRDNHRTASESLWQALLVFAVTVAISFAAMKWYDEPVRKWLGKKFEG